MSALSKMEKSQVEFLLRDNNDSSVAKQFGVTRQAVYAIRRKFGIPSSRYKAPARRARILDMRRDGATVPKIATVLGMSQSYVYKVLRNNPEGLNGKSGAESPVQNPA